MIPGQSEQSWWKRLDLYYFRRLPKFRSSKRWLSIGMAVIAVGWIATAKLTNDRSLYSSGPMSVGHVFFADECSQCHTSSWRSLRGIASRKAAEMNEACLACHVTTIGHDTATHVAHHVRDPSVLPPSVRDRQSACQACHVEHTGQRLRMVADERCLDCHKKITSAPPGYGDPGDPHAALRLKVTSAFPKGHAEFWVPNHDPGTIKFSHAGHLKRQVIDGEEEQLQCSDCHRAGRSSVPWRRKEPKPILHAEQWQTLAADEPELQARSMNPIRFDLHCARCHELAVDVSGQRLRDGAVVPHDTPAEIRSYLSAELAWDIVKKQAGDVGRASEPDKIHRVAAEEVTAERRILERMIFEDQRLCAECHTQRPPSIEKEDDLFIIEKPGIKQRWFEQEWFSHERHRNWACMVCHPGASTSQLADDILLPAKDVCAGCHAPADVAIPTTGARFQCVVCHTYHEPPPTEIIVPSLTPEQIGASVTKGARVADH